MPAAKCTNCGGQTNSTTSDYWDLDTGYSKATECYAKFENGKWMPGCALDTAPSYKTDFARSLIEEASKDLRAEDDDFDPDAAMESG